MQILKDDPGRIKGFDMLEETLHVGLQGLGRISIRSVHAHGIGAIAFSWMHILEEDPGRIEGFGTRVKDFCTFVETQIWK